MDVLTDSAEAAAVALVVLGKERLCLGIFLPLISKTFLLPQGERFEDLILSGTCTREGLALTLQNYTEKR